MTEGLCAKDRAREDIKDVDDVDTSQIQKESGAAGGRQLKIRALLRQPKVNYQKVMEVILEENEERGHTPRLLLHSCCAPCSSYVLEYLTQYFSITVLYYNPNIYPPEEFDKRARELRRLISEMPVEHEVTFVEGRYEPWEFYGMAEGLEDLPEGGERCFGCYRQRLEEAAAAAKKGGFDYFTTTLSISPMKNAAKLNEIGAELAGKYGVPYLYSDFKKRDGYKRSIELSAQYGLYRQDYCGCEFSLAARNAASKI